MNENNKFKICSCCGFVWKSREDFLNDNNISIIGYQAHFQNLTAGLFLFNHSCHGTLSLKTGIFTDLYNGPVFQEKVTGSDDCPGYCLYENILDPCPAKCECAFVREIIQILKKKTMPVISYPMGNQKNNRPCNDCVEMTHESIKNSGGDDITGSSD